MATKTLERRTPKGKEFDIEEELKSLYNLQKVDSKVDEIQVLKGELPIEVKDLEDELAGLQTRIKKLQEELDNFEDSLKQKKQAIKDAESHIKKYEKQQNNVKNNREYDALSKEIEMQKLDILLAEKKIKDSAEEKKMKNTMIEEAEKVIKAKQKELNNKKKELEVIIEETDKEEKSLEKKSKEAQSHIEERLLVAYHKIRQNFRNGLAVVKVQRDACGGCFNQIPPQKQMEIRQRKKIIVCEHCGRITVDVDIDVK